MKRRTMALLAALALVVSVCAVTASAGEAVRRQPAAQVQEPAAQDTAADDTAGEEEEPAQQPEEKEDPSPAGPDDAQVDPTTGEAVEEATIVPDEVGTVSYANIERRMREKNLNVLILQESVDFIDNIDYDKLSKDLKDTLHAIAQGQRGMSLASSLPADNPYYTPMDSYAYSQLTQTYDTLYDQFKSIRDGEMQEDNAGAVRQLKNLQDQVVMGGEMLYTTIAGLESQEAALQRQLAALNRTVEEMELRYQLGQVSALQLQQTKAGRTQLTSGLETLRMNIRNLKTQFEMMLGAEQTGEITLGAVPEVREKDLAAMDLEKDLLAYKTQSYDLYAAAKTLEDAKDDYDDAGKEYGYRMDKLEFARASHNWQAAQYTYNDSVQNYELKFRTLFAQVGDYKQIYDAAKVSLESEKASYAASELKYQQGTISKNALLSAQDSLKEAEDKVTSAANDLFASYNTYCWAVKHGVLN